MKHSSYLITIEKDGRGYYYSEDFPGVYGIGKTIEAAQESILGAMRRYFQQLQDLRG